MLIPAIQSRRKRDNILGRAGNWEELIDESRMLDIAFFAFVVGMRPWIRSGG